MKRITKKVLVSNVPKRFKEVELSETELLNDIAATNRRISNNIAFFFWLSIAGIVMYSIITFGIISY